MDQKIRIFLIEDEVLTAMRLKQIINSDHYEVVHSVNNGDDALKYIDQNSIDLILADVNLQGELNGFDIAKKIQRFNLPIIFITAQKDDDALIQAASIEHSTYIVKPFTADDIITAIKLATLKYNLSRDNTTLPLGKGYEFNRSDQKLYRYNREIALTKKELELLTLLINTKNSICTTEILYSHLWNEKVVHEATRRNLIFKLKQKIPDLEILTHKGIGYQIRVGEQSSILTNNRSINDSKN